MKIKKMHGKARAENRGHTYSFSTHTEPDIKLCTNGAMYS